MPSSIVVAFAVLYFAYGTNLSKELIENRCPGVVPVCPAVLDNYRLAFVGTGVRWEGGGVATIIRDDGSRVLGALYKLTHTHEITLDRYEGVPNSYTKQFVTIDDRPALTYVHVVANENPPSKSYLDTIRRGYLDWGLSPEFLDTIKTIALAP
jgi:hypothetical protein